MLLVYISLSFLLGLWLGNYWHQPVFFALLPVGVVSLVIHIVKKPNGRIWLIAGLVCICCVLGIIRTAYSGGEEIPEQLREYNDSGTVELHGMVAENPQSGSTTTRLVVSVSEITTDTAHNDISGKVLVYLPQHEHYEYGDVIAVSGGLQTPVNFADFDYRQYLADQGIYSVLWYPHIELLDSGQGNVCKSLLYTVQNTGAEILDILLPQPQASLARALLLGQRDSLPDDVREEFAISGVSHILAISGLHLGIIAGIFIYTGIALMGRKRYLYVWVAMVLVWLYALLTGMNPPVVRNWYRLSSPPNGQ